MEARSDRDDLGEQVRRLVDQLKVFPKDQWEDFLEAKAEEGYSPDAIMIAKGAAFGQIVSESQTMPEEPVPGTRIGDKYILQEKLGEGTSFVMFVMVGMMDFFGD